MKWQLSAFTAYTRVLGYITVLHPRNVDNRRFALHLNSCNSSQIRSHPVFHWKAIRFAAPPTCFCL